MSTPTAESARSKPARRARRPGPLDAVQVGGHPLRYYLTGWRFGIVALLIAAVLPAFQNQTMLVVAISIGVYVLLALGLNIVVGYAGLLDLGYVAFFVTGAYTV